MKELDFGKANGLIPAIIQHNDTLQVLMLGYMNEEAVLETLDRKRVTFFSRSRQRLWLKGETSGNYLNLISMEKDCDCDALLLKVIPEGNVCHRDVMSCFSDKEAEGIGFLSFLQYIVKDRIENPREGSYTSELIRQGEKRIAQKVGEEAIECVIDSLTDRDALKNEVADLLFHVIVLLASKDLSILEVIEILRKRHSARQKGDISGIEVD
ncbi:MAG: bifunctional phosphoribosyl-AMP cyclohydrolase/phosphoribosyl-ATP diphosphatase HisIE [Candidatus Coatesbacteria bacterium]|nr:bifunctional phosphoribosyl-AMP cyclohydrolase/phosphoribosyl-ATP diphosphatase HisIE [Candidatus Coatesbacteria bacterium]